jgi:hypothetical protein
VCVKSSKTSSNQEFWTDRRTSKIVSTLFTALNWWRGGDDVCVFACISFAILAGMVSRVIYVQDYSYLNLELLTGTLQNL